jgi:hypothetical protein
MNEVLTPGNSSAKSSEAAEFRTQCFFLCLVSALVGLETRWPAGFLLIAVGGVVFADAWTVGIRRQSDGSRLGRASPLLWGISVELLPIVALPIYFFVRHRFRSRKGNRFVWILLIVIASTIYLLWPFMPVSLLVGPFD